jgi:hypothetical protein
LDGNNIILHQIKVQDYLFRKEPEKMKTKMLNIRKIIIIVLAAILAGNAKSQLTTLPGNIYSSVKSLYTGKEEFGLISFRDGYQIIFSGSTGEINLQQMKKLFEENKAALKERYGTTVLEELREKVHYVAHSHPQNARPRKMISLISPPKAFGPSFTASDADFDFTKIIGIPHYIIDQTTIVLIDGYGNFVNSWLWRDDGTTRKI